MPNPDSSAAASLPAGMLRPDYTGGGIVNLMSSILTGRGGKSGYLPARLLADIPVAQYRNVLLLMIDGLGYEYLLRRWPDSAIARHLRGRMTSVFPTTTAAAVTTFLTGLAPAQHALTGWHVWLEEIQTVTAVLPFRSRTGRESLQARGFDATKLLDARPLYPGLDVVSHVISPRRIARSAFNVAFSGGATVHDFDDLDGYFARILAVVNGDTAEKFIYAYWPDLDHLGHQFGIESGATSRHFKEIDEGFARLTTELEDSGTLVILTADHGFVDSTPATHVSLDGHAALTAMLDVPLCGEPRAAYCYVHENEGPAFVNYVGAELAGSIHAVPSHDLLEAGLFGPGTPHPAVQRRIGNYTLLMGGNYIVHDTLPGEKPISLIGVHGGLTADELYVPLVIVQT